MRAVIRYLYLYEAPTR